MGKTKTSFVSEEILPADRQAKNEKKQHEAHKGDENKVHVAGLKGGQRVTMVDSAQEEVAPEPQEETKKKKVVEKIRSQKYQDVKAKIEAGKVYPIAPGIKLVKETSYSKFDGTMELHLVLKKIGVSAQVSLPHMAGREKKIEIATDETIEKLKSGKIDFDVLVATPDMMPKLVPFARILGPKGLMPNPKNGTLVADPKKAKGFSANTLSIKTEKEAPLIHTVVGKVSQDDAEIKANIEAILKALGGSRQVLKAYIKSTMSPSVKIVVA